MKRNERHPRSYWEKLVAEVDAGMTDWPALSMKRVTPAEQRGPEGAKQTTSTYPGNLRRHGGLGW